MGHIYDGHIMALGNIHCSCFEYHILNSFFLLAGFAKKKLHQQLSQPTKISL